MRLKSSRFSPQPHWKTATRMPYAAATESRLRTIALSAITIERNATSRSRNANRRTKPKTSGADDFIIALKSKDAAVEPADGVLDTGDRADRGRDELVAEGRKGVVRDRVGATTGERDCDIERLPVIARLDLDRVLHLAGGECPCLQVCDCRP